MQIHVFGPYLPLRLLIKYLCESCLTDSKNTNFFEWYKCKKLHKPPFLPIWVKLIVILVGILSKNWEEMSRLFSPEKLPRKDLSHRFISEKSSREIFRSSKTTEEIFFSHFLSQKLLENILLLVLPLRIERNNFFCFVFSSRTDRNIFSPRVGIP